MSEECRVVVDLLTPVALIYLSVGGAIAHRTRVIFERTMSSSWPTHLTRRRIYDGQGHRMHRMAYDNGSGIRNISRDRTRT